MLFKKLFMLICWVQISFKICLCTFVWNLVLIWTGRQTIVLYFIDQKGLREIGIKREPCENRGLSRNCK